MLQAIKTLCKNFSDEDYIFNDVQIVFIALESYYGIHSEFGQSRERDRIFDEIKLKLLLGFLKCPVFEKKLAAIIKLSELRNDKRDEKRNIFRRQA